MRRAALFVLAFAFASADAAAQDAAEPIAVDYEVPGTCPSATWFMSEVAARTSRVRPASGGERARTLVVRIDANYTGRLVIDDAGQRTTPRELRGATCAETASALALVAALAVDPQASTAPRPAPPEAPAASSASSPSAAPAPPPPPSPAPSASASTSPSASAPPPSTTTTTREPTFAVGAQAELAAWSDAVVAFRLFGDLSLGHPSFRLAIARSLTVDRSAAIGSASLAWTTVSAAACPLRLALADSIALRPCAELAGGTLSAEGQGVTAPESRSRPWITAAAHGRLVWALARAFAIEVEGGGMVPFFRESFFFMPGIPVYEAPAVVGFGRIGASVRFP